MSIQDFGGTHHSRQPARPVAAAMARGFRQRCPSCGRGRLFNGFLKTVDRCTACGAEMHHHRADDLPAYLVIFIVGHVVVGAFMGAEKLFLLSAWQHLAIWVPAAIAGSILLLAPVKGAIVGMQWALYMHGFGGEHPGPEDTTHPEL